MHYRLLANTGLYVSELCLGTMTFGGRGNWKVVGALDPAASEALVKQALESGINFFDTANIYSEGESETIFGQALQNLGSDRETLVIATKCRGRMGAGPNQVGLSRKHIFEAVDASLRRLQTDYIDLYQIHGVDPLTPIEETMDALDALVTRGKVRYIGYCNLPAWYAMKAIAYARGRQQARFISAQMYYSIAGRDIEREVVPLVQDQHLALLPWSPLAGGLLSGKFDLDSPGPEGARRASFDFPPVDLDRARGVLQVMREVATEQERSVAEVALAWLLTRPYVTSVIIGARTPEQLMANLQSTDVELTADQVTRLDAASALPQEYPGWMVGRQAGDRIPKDAR